RSLSRTDVLCPVSHPDPISSFQERAADDSKEVESFQQLLAARTQEFIEEILSPPFGGMISFVKEAELLIEKGQVDKLKAEEGEVTSAALPASQYPAWSSQGNTIPAG
ncbi:hypothetical protein chiPu_0025971, partial [Chiloscyllium punctatum]|nr:hypothetical protein [Chiloscyllium punctatum]